MKQAPHIFWKDVRYLRREAALVAAIAAMFALAQGGPGGAWWAEMLLTIAATYLIARVVQAEPIPGANQFWITRPYRPWSLLAAKLMFIVAFVSLPVCLAQLYIVLRAGFPPGAIWPGLLWSQVVTFAVVILPIAALAAMTAELMPFLFAALAVLATAFSTRQMAWLLVSRPASLPLPWPVPVEWVREAALGMALAASASVVLYLQYKYRWTAVSRAVAIAGILAGAAAFQYMPWGFALAVQGQLSGRDVDSQAANVAANVAVDTQSKLSRAAVPGKADGRFQIRIPIVVTSNAIAVPDAFRATFEAPDGRLWTSEAGGVNRTVRGPEKFEATVLMPKSFAVEARDQLLTTRGAIWLTLFREAGSKSIRLNDGPVNVMDGLQCFPREFDSLWCRSAFRWPNRLIYARVRENDVRPLKTLVSYSPFPGEPSFNPIEAHWAPGTVRPDDEIEIMWREPVAHVKRDFAIGTMRISDLAAGR